MAKHKSRATTTWSETGIIYKCNLHVDVAYNHITRCVRNLSYAIELSAIVCTDLSSKVMLYNC
uniref:Uncharacterized protein n=1 Tax=Megaselia scalaris TaxID=36166 RepID=T1GXQ3_MEGSC